MHDAVCKGLVEELASNAKRNKDSFLIRFTGRQATPFLIAYVTLPIFKVFKTKQKLH